MTIVGLIVRLFGRKTVDGILSSLTKVLNELVTLADELEAEAAQKVDQIEKLRAEISDNDAASNRARLVAENIARLVECR